MAYIMKNDSQNYNSKYRTDPFFVFVYILVALMLAAQIGIIVWGALS